MDKFTYGRHIALDWFGRYIIIGWYHKWDIAEFSREKGYSHLDLGPLCITWENK